MTVRCEDHYLLHIEVLKCMHSVCCFAVRSGAPVWKYMKKKQTRSLFLCVYTNIESLVDVVPVPNQANTQTLIILILYNNSSFFVVVLWRWQVSVPQFRPLDRRYFKPCYIYIFSAKSSIQVLKQSIHRLQCRVYLVGCLQHSYRFTFL